jgi:hypothetical protein
VRRPQVLLPIFLSVNKPGTGPASIPSLPLQTQPKASFRAHSFLLPVTPTISREQSPSLLPARVYRSKLEGHISLFPFTFVFRYQHCDQPLVSRLLPRYSVTGRSEFKVRWLSLAQLFGRFLFLCHLPFTSFLNLPLRLVLPQKLGDALIHLVYDFLLHPLSLFFFNPPLSGSSVGSSRFSRRRFAHSLPGLPTSFSFDSPLTCGGHSESQRIYPV